MKTLQITQSYLDTLLMALGHRENLSGTQYLRDAVHLYASGYTRMTKELYPEIAKLYGTTADRVERCMRHSIETAMSNGDWENWAEVFGGSINPVKGKPTNGEYIARLARLVRANEN